MFAKPYKLKSNITLKNSGKKQLAQRISHEFPSATEEKVKELVPAKSNVSYMELVLHSEDTVGVFVVDGLPMMIDLGESLVPTVCALWKAPDLLPVICIHTPVLSKMQGGAPLYVPGVHTQSQFPLYRKGTIIAACTGDNAAACVVGRAVISSADLLRDRMGVCLETLHVFGDQLCKEKKFVKIERPKLEPAVDIHITDLITDISQLTVQSVKEEWPSLVKEEPSPVNEPKIIAVTPEPVTTERQDVENNELNDTMTSDISEDSIPSDMDGLLRWCLLSFLKLEGKNVELPLKTNLLYRNHLMPLCPPDRSLDVKKSSFKKMGKFLEAMEREGFIQVREIDKGVDALVAMDLAHPLVRAHAARGASGGTGGVPLRADDEYVPPVVRELYCITANVLDLFLPMKKGTALSAGEVRSTVSDHVKAHNLTAPTSRGSVVLDTLLAKVTGKKPQEVIKREELTLSVLGRMTPATETRFADGTVTLSKTRLQPVTMQVVTRSGNKKVTLVSNLQGYGLELSRLSRGWQALAGAACGITRSPGAKDDQLMLQGDQTHFVAKMLIEKYGLPKKFLEGADKALNKKK